jgi:hypothetical protein
VWEEETSMLKGHMILIGVLVGLSMMVWGCAGNLPQAQRADIFDQHQGTSFESAMSKQVLNPEAGKEPVPAVGFDGEAAAANMQKYRDVLKRAEKAEEVAGVGLKLTPLAGGGGR